MLTASSLAGLMTTLLPRSFASQIARFVMIGLIKKAKTSECSNIKVSFSDKKAGKQRILTKLREESLSLKMKEIL